MLISTTILFRIRVRLWVNWGVSHDDRAALDETVPHKDPMRLLILDREAGGQGLAEGSIVTERAGCCQSRSPHQMADGTKQKTVLVACPVGTHPGCCFQSLCRSQDCLLLQLASRATAGTLATNLVRRSLRRYLRECGMQRAAMHGIQAPWPSQLTE